MRGKPLAALAAGMWLVAWFLPVVSDRESGGWLPGWDAFRVSLSPIWPYEGISSDPIWFESLSVASGLTNFVFLGAWLRLLLRKSAGPWALLLACGAINFLTWWLLTEARSELLAGYYVWLASYFVLAVALRTYPRPGRANAATAV